MNRIMVVGVLVAVIFSLDVGADQELGLILQSDSWSELQQNRQKLKEQSVHEQACRIQIQKKMIPEACLKTTTFSKERIHRACLESAFATLSLAMIERALRHQGWQASCRRQLVSWKERKIYQGEDAELGAPFEKIEQDEGDLEAKTPEL